MPFSRKDLFLKTLWWSIVGAVIVVVIFWLLSDIFHFLKGGNNIVAFTNGIIYSSVIGNIAGAGLVFWRIVDKYYHKKMHDLNRYYVRWSVLSFVVVIGILYTPLSIITAVWSVVPPLYVLHIFSKNDLFGAPKRKASR